MAVRIGLVSAGSSGNIFNIKKALEASGAGVSVIEQPDGFEVCDKIVIPGVGTFGAFMDAISPLREALIEAVSRKPTLGICLGMQILATRGYEFGEHEGLGLISGEVKRIEVKGKVPHMGYAAIHPRQDSPLFAGIEPDALFYFMHSYEFVNYTDVLALSTYRNHWFVSGVAKGHLMGVQFHPEKSREPGLRLLANFARM